MTDISRRSLFKSAAVIGAATSIPVTLRGQSEPSPQATKSTEPHINAAPPKRTYRFFNPQEVAFIEAAVDRLIPADAEWPGALWAEVPYYIDGQLQGAYGQGARFYASGPWQKGEPTQGYQLPLNPSHLYRRSLGAIFEQLGRRHMDFVKASPEQKDAFLRALESGSIDLGGVPSEAFFETLLANTIEGYFSDPSYGGNRDMVGWRMIGFPGAYAAYLNIYTNHGVKFEREPLSIASRGSDHHAAHARHSEATTQGTR